MIRMVVAALIALVVGYSVAQADGVQRRGKIATMQPPPTVGVDWNGVYVGAHGPYHFDNMEGFGAGAQVGANVHFQSGLVLGVELDYTKVWLDRVEQNIGEETTLVGRLDQYGSLRGRIGYAFGNVMVFGTAGYAMGWAKFDIDSEGGLVDTRRVEGLVWGGGAEARLSNMTLKLEYLRYEFGNKGPAAIGNELAVEQDVVRFGVNFPLNTSAPFGWMGM